MNKGVSIIVVFIVLLAIVTSVGGCGSTPAPSVPEATAAEPTSPSAAEPEPTQASAAEPEPATEGEGKTLHLALTNPPKNLDPYVTDYTYDAEAMLYTHCQLARFAPDQSLQPYLASWDTSEDGTEYTFHIDEGALWHDGQPVTAEDVVFTFEMIAHPDTGSIYARDMDGIKGAPEYRDGAATDIEGLEIVDEKTLKLTLTEPNPSFLPRLASFMVIVPKHLLGSVEMAKMPEASYWREPVGCGPYEWIEYATDQYIHLAKFPDFFLGEPKIDEIFVHLGSVESLELAFEKGQVDVVKVQATEIERFREMPFATLYATDSHVENLQVNCQHPFLEDATFRKALMYAIDRESIVNAGYLGSARIAENCFVTPWTLSPNITTYEYDPDKARELLAEAGWDGSVTFNILLGTGRPERERATLIIQQNLADVGITTEIESMEGGTVIDRTDKGEYDMAVVGFGTMSLLPDTATNYLAADALIPNGANASFYIDNELTALLHQTTKAVDQEARQELFYQITEMTSDRLPLLPLVVSQNVVAVRSDRVVVPESGIIPRNRPGGELSPVTWDIINWDVVE